MAGHFAEALLSSESVNVNVACNSTLTSLHKAAAAGDILVTKLLLQHKNVDMNRGSFQHLGRTPLHLAIENEHYQVVRLLLDHKGLDVNCLTTYGRAIDWVANQGSLEMMSLLLHHPDISINALYPSGVSPLSLVIERSSVEMLQLLLHRSDIDLDAISHDIAYNGETALQVILQTSALISDALVDLPPEDIARLLSNHGDVRYKNRDLSWKPALELAEMYECWPAFNLLLNYEPRGLLRQWYSKSGAIKVLVLHFKIDSLSEAALIADEVRLLRLLEKQVLSTNARRPDGKTLLEHATEQDYLQLARFLLKDDPASWSASKQHGAHCAVTAAQKGHLEILKLLWERELVWKETNRSRRSTISSSSERSTGSRPVHLVRPEPLRRLRGQ